MAQGASPAPNDAAAAAAEVRRIAALENCCTTLCLWEPDARLMIRKAKGQERARKSEHAAEARKADRSEDEKHRLEEIRAFEEHFAVELRAAEETAREVGEAAALDAKAREALDWWLEQVRMLHALVSGAAHFLPTNTREKLNKSVDELEARQREARERLAPRKKFGFKNRSKVAGRQAAAPAAAATGAGTDGAGAAPAPAPAARDAAPLDGRGRDTLDAAPAGCEGFRDRADAALVRGAGEAAAGDFALQNLTRCTVLLKSTSRALWIRGLRHCTVVAVPVGGSIYVTDCEDCTLYLGARQLRVHTSARVDLYVHASSHPILEHCTALRFAPYPPLPAALAATAFAAASGLRADHNEWNHVEDFDWLKATHSPNWGELPEAERKAPEWE